MGFPFIPMMSVCIWQLGAVKVSYQNYNSEKEKKTQKKITSLI